MVAINLDEDKKITQIAYDENLLDMYIDNENTLVIDTKIKGDVIDANFNELDKRLSDVESQMRLRFLGEIQRLRSENETLSNRINQLESANIKLGE